MRCWGAFGGGCCINWTWPAFAQLFHVAKYIQGSTLFLAIQQVFKGTLELCIMSLDLSLSHCSEIGFCRVETCGLLARQLVQSRDISRLSELAFVNWVTALIKTCLFMLFSGCSETSGYLERWGESAVHAWVAPAALLSLYVLATKSSSDLLSAGLVLLGNLPPSMLEREGPAALSASDCSIFASR